MTTTVPAGRSDRVAGGSLAVAMVLAITMNAFEAMAVVTAMPTVAEDLDGDWLYGAAFSAYMLANLVSLVFSGEQSDRYGPARPFALGIATFTLGLVIASIAPTMAVLVVGRALQGAGAGAFSSVAYVAISRGYPSERQPRLFALLSAAWIVPTLIAPALAGVVTEQAHWRWVFAGLLPLPPILVALALPALRGLPAPAPPAGGGAPERRLPLALVLAAGAGLAVAGLQATRWWVAVPLLGAGVAIARPAIVRLFPPGTGRARPGLPALLASRLCVNVAFFGTDTFVPLAANRIHGVGPLAAGLVITGASLTWSMGAQLSARRGERSLPGAVVRVGFGFIVVGVALVMPVVVASTPLPLTFLAWSVAGVGMGLVFNTTAVTAMGGAPAGREGLVSSQLQIADTLGFALISGIGGALVGLADRDVIGLASGLTVQFALALLAALAGAWIAGRVRTATTPAP